jgi:hypothetical protein
VTTWRLHQVESDQPEVELPEGATPAQVEVSLGSQGRKYLVSWWEQVVER